MGVDLSLSVTRRGTENEQCLPSDHIQATLMTLEPGVNLGMDVDLYKVQMYQKGNHCHGTSSLELMYLAPKINRLLE